jgi:putative membrane-bound dehydrogenase-like protein
MFEFQSRSIARAIVRVCSFIFVCGIGALSVAQFNDPTADRQALPTVPAGFEVSLFAREPLVRQPCSLAFDKQGRLFVGMGPQYRNPTRETPGDSVVIVSDADGDGLAESTKVFASGFNAVQGLAWHGNDLWVANAPDLTVVRDLDGDDEADEYVRIYTDLGNLEHGLHGLNWAPDGKLYMSKGNSKGLTQPGRIAPKPFRDLWGVTAPAGSPDFPTPITYTKHDYQHAYHHPSDDWGMEGGILRCDDGGSNLEIVSRGFRNPWDITADSGFNWLGTDNDQTNGDRIFMPFFGAHFGWNHPWSAHWSNEPHAPSAPVSGPFFEGSGTGIIFADSAKFADEFRGVYFINDWLNKTTFVWRPTWDGALLRPQHGNWEPFVVGGQSLYRPTDLEVGPDGALWILGWSSGYGAEWKDGELTNEGRIYRVSATSTVPSTQNGNLEPRTLNQFAVAELVDRFKGPLPVWRIDAQDELVRRGVSILPELLAEVRGGQLTEMQETWALWTIGRLPISESGIEQYFADLLGADSAANLNQRLQAIRILAMRTREAAIGVLPEVVHDYLNDGQPRLRFAAVQAILQAHQTQAVPGLLKLLADEADETIFYAAWQALRELSSPGELRDLLSDANGGVRRAALLALLETHSLSKAQVLAMNSDSDPQTVAIAQHWLDKMENGGEQAVIEGRPLNPTSELSGSVVASRDSVALVRNLISRSQNKYRLVPGGLVEGGLLYTDREYKFLKLPVALQGLDLIQTANDDDRAQGDAWLSFEALVPLRLTVAVDKRHSALPAWIRQRFNKTEGQIVSDDSTLDLYTRDYPAGSIELGGNTDRNSGNSIANYIVFMEPFPLVQRTEPESIDGLREQALSLLESADPTRGEILFKHRGGAGCSKCHSLNADTNAFGPNLSSIGSRAAPKHIVESMIEPNKVITEGFNLLTVLTEDGNVYSGVLLEESGLSLAIGLSTGDRVDIPKSLIEERKTSRVSGMPSMAAVLTAQQIADLSAYLISQTSQAETAVGAKSDDSKLQDLSFDQKSDRLIISLKQQEIAEFVFDDPQILRPYFTRLRTAGGLQVTRNHPPVVGKDPVDHETMHPGIWLAFGDINGSDFWRNNGHIKHVRFITDPTIDRHRLVFSTESTLLSTDQQVLGRLMCRFACEARSNGWLLVWDATFLPLTQDLVFGDQEEMGFGVRVATPLSEKSGGLITNSSGLTTATATWGQAAQWCDYSGKLENEPVGVTLLAHPNNFRESWWHNRDYGILVANPFGRAAMRQGKPSSIHVERDQPLRLVFGAVIHSGSAYDPKSAHEAFVNTVRDLR